MANIKISTADVDKMIKEEFQKMMEKKKLSTKLSAINEELQRMNEEDINLNEVEADGETKVASSAWTGKPGGDVKFKPKFEKIGSHLKEDEGDIEDEMGGSSEGGAPEDEMGGDHEMETPAMGEFEAKFAEIGRAIDAKMASEGGAEPEMGATAGEEVATQGPSDDDFEDVEVSDDKEEVAEDTKTIGHTVGNEQHLSPEKAHKIDEPTNNLKGEVQESVEEPLEGHSVAQETEADKVNDNMEKDKHVKEAAAKKGAVITEGSSTQKNIFTEGLDASKKARMLEEFNRMKKFAGLSKNEE